MELANKKIFVDTTAFILFLHGRISREGKDIYEMALKNKLKLFTSSRCLDELIFKEMRLLAEIKYNLRNKIIEKLRSNPQIVKEIGRELSGIVKNLLKVYDVSVIEVKSEWVLELPEIMEQTGLFGNDALIIRAMQSRNLKYLLTADRDFTKVESEFNLKIISALSTH